MDNYEEIKIIGYIDGKSESFFLGKDGTRKSTSRILIKENGTGKIYSASYDYQAITWQAFNEMWGQNQTEAPLLEVTLEKRVNGNFENYKIIRYGLANHGPTEVAQNFQAEAPSTQSHGFESATTPADPNLKINFNS